MKHTLAPTRKEKKVRHKVKFQNFVEFIEHEDPKFSEDVYAAARRGELSVVRWLSRTWVDEIANAMRQVDSGDIRAEKARGITMRVFKSVMQSGKTTCNDNFVERFAGHAKRQVSRLTKRNLIPDGVTLRDFYDVLKRAEKAECTMEDPSWRRPVMTNEERFAKIEFRSPCACMDEMRFELWQFARLA